MTDNDTTSELVAAILGHREAKLGETGMLGDPDTADLDLWDVLDRLVVDDVS